MNADSKARLLAAIIEQLKEVIDPETNADVMRMRLIEDLVVNSVGQVSYTFRPSSPFYPIAVYLAKLIKGAVGEVPGVTSQHITVDGYVAADELTKLINKET